LINAKWHAQNPMPKNASTEQRIAWHIRHARRCACRPVPARLAALIETRPHQTKTKGRPFTALLSGGDRRSVAESDRVLDLVRRNPIRVSELVGLTQDEDWLVSMRALDLLEKLAHERPDWIAPHKGVFIGELADSDKWEIRLQIVRALPLFDWSPAAQRRVVEILLRDIGHTQKFVKAWALDSLATLSEKDASLRGVVSRSLREFEESGSKALASRARQIRRRLSWARDSGSGVMGRSGIL
jgi:hypothetical protein